MNQVTLRVLERTTVDERIRTLAELLKVHDRCECISPLISKGAECHLHTVASSVTNVMGSKKVQVIATV